MNALLEKKRQGRVSVGMFSQLSCATAVECIGAAGFDYVIIDSEHASLDTSYIAQAITSADCAGLTPVVRIGEISRRAVVHALDSGAQGIIVPAIETVDQVRELIHYAKFAPMGGRGFAPARHCRWGLADCYQNGAAAYMDYCNHETLLIPQCETAACLDRIEEVCSLEGVDGIFVGPLDLSTALGCPMELDHPRVLSAMDRIVSACQDNGKLSMIYCPDAQAAHAMAQKGYDSTTVGADLYNMLSALQAIREQCRF